MKNNNLLHKLEELERNNILTIDQIEHSATFLAKNQEFCNHSWKVVNQVDGVEYVYHNGQLIPNMYNNHYIINENWSK
ncbi:hypothetical protein [Lactobacillus crispatus]|jgi:hypothetical protein|uniref:Uncharacterized protein n=2 Tax=Lactobacillus crispatus TaxID=47770 RepID=A0A4V3BI20_9LACO|nr:hypothetical protein [Lactobacillus crispatus]EKB62350.1 hypothetical protein HMPREF9249_02315 [Lactobacillus crispatus FB077-07]MBG0721530.1 hypothetical protein [Lactobacillus crispatus]MBI1711200.1 hypothetical protein [Lactobacillus crispatus]MCT7820982.1 hypothetical protein [Lactobacillus crispatus]MDX5126837.1 hypothetical protein [Lactobacillus crispatus]